MKAKVELGWHLLRSSRLRKWSKDSGYCRRGRIHLEGSRVSNRPSGLQSFGAEYLRPICSMSFGGLVLLGRCFEAAKPPLA